MNTAIEAFAAKIDALMEDWFDNPGSGTFGTFLAFNLFAHQEQRTLADGMGGISTNYKTGETTVTSRPCTRQSRWVTPWVNDTTPVLDTTVLGKRDDQ